MKKIIDANFFQDPSLEDYLSSDKGNIVVFTDTACMEAYKGNAIKNISKSIEIVSKFPDQVIVLKGTREVANLIVSPSASYLLEDPEQTRGFKRFCQDVQRAVGGDEVLAAKIRRKGQLASNHFDLMREEASIVAKAIEGIGRSFHPEHLMALKRGNLVNEVIEKIFNEILLIAAFLFLFHPDDLELPKAPQVRNSYVFRFAVSSYLLALQWISDGGPRNVRAEKMRNDVVDMSYVAYASFFDGLLTRDKKMQQIYEEACIFLETLFT